jgi:hypothetical protein
MRVKELQIPNQGGETESLMKASRRGRLAVLRADRCVEWKERRGMPVPVEEISAAQ